MKNRVEVLKKALPFKIILVTAFFISSNSFARDYIHIVGSSTVYPFATVIAENFGTSGDFKTPIIESTGTGGGFKLFCSGVGKKFPDFADASRRIEESEIEQCKQNGIHNPIEIKIGYDGIVLANSIKAKPYNLTKEQIFLALAEKIPQNGNLVNNPYKKWSDINPSLPNKEIAIYGPPTTSGTRDAFFELVMEEPCMKINEFIKLYPDKKQRKKICSVIRTDGKFIEAGENDNLIVQKLKNNPNALGIFGFSFLKENGQSIQAAKIDAVTPSFDNIIGGHYSVSRPLFIYFKKEHLKLTIGTREFINEIVSVDTIGPQGYLIDKGLIPMKEKEFKEMRDRVLESL